MSDYFMAFTGGVLHSIASTVNLFYKGRLTDFSKVLWGSLCCDQETFNWKFSFLMAFLFTGSLARLFTAFDKKSTLFDSPEDSVASLSNYGFLLGGLLVGLGTKLTGGCTGHALCGVPRLSLRSAAIFGIFTLSGFLAANLCDKYELFSSQYHPDVFILSIFDSSYAHLLVLYTSFVALVAFLWNKLSKRNHKAVENIMIGAYVGLIYALGVIVSGTIKRSKVIHFLTISKDWDPSLLIMMIAAIGLTLVTFQVILGMNTPFRSTVWDFSDDIGIDARTIVGSVLFGLGWGITGLTPGPALLLAQFGTIKISFLYIGAMLIGQAIIHSIEKVHMDQYMNKEGPKMIMNDLLAKFDSLKDLAQTKMVGYGLLAPTDKKDSHNEFKDKSENKAERKKSDDGQGVKKTQSGKSVDKVDPQFATKRDF